jgi:hypothetical protein
MRAEADGAMRYARPHDCLAFDFDFASSEGFSAPTAVEQPPAVQLAFEYTVIVPVRAVGTSGCDYQLCCVLTSLLSRLQQQGAPGSSAAAEPSTGDAAAVVSFVRERRRRIVTLPAKIARTRRQVFETCDPEVTAVLLTHKALRAAATDGLAEARLMLTDWLAALVARASEAFPSGAGATPDASLTACATLTPLPRTVFGLLCSPLLRALRVHPDERAHAAHLAAALPPQSLACLLYPRMMSWRGAETRDDDQLPLSRAGMAIAGAPLFVVDGFTIVVVYAAPTVPGMPAEPFPPPHKARRCTAQRCAWQSRSR